MAVNLNKMGKKNLSNTLRVLERTVMKNDSKIFVTLVSLLFVIFLLNSFFTINSNYELNKKILEINEFNEPINISLFIIDCNECSDVSSVVDGIKNKNVNIIKENSFDSNSNEAKDLISKYNIQKLPSVIITGEVNSNKTKFNNFELKNDALIFGNVNAPYFDILSGKIKGRVEIIEIIDSSCQKCIDLSSIPIGFEKAGVLISDWKKVEYNSAEGKELIGKFKVKDVPALLISTEINYYKNIKEGLDKLNLDEKQGFYVLHAVQPPYRNLTLNKIVGLVDLIILNDSSCSECYNVNINKQILAGLGIALNTEKVYDISSSSGKNLISKYNIQKVPIILLSPEAKAYDSFINAWKPIGSIEDDGWFVMRGPEALGIVKDIVNNTIIRTKK